MRAALLEANGHIVIGEFPDPSDSESVIVGVKAAGVCGTELHFLDRLLQPDAYPFILGHEIAGVVETVPDRESGFRPGDRVAIYNVIGCGSCRYCAMGRTNLCDRPRQIGFNVHGGFAEFVAAPPQTLVRIPDTVPFETAAVLACSGMAAVHAARAAEVTLNTVAIVNGIGGVGLMVIQVARLAGADVIAIGDSDAKLALAKEFGAVETIRAADAKDYEAVPGRVQALVGGGGADYFFELVGTSASMAAGFRSLGKRGTFVSIGYTGDNLVVNPVDLLIKEQRLMTCVAAAKQDLDDAVSLAGAGKLRAAIQNRVPLDQLLEALRNLRERRVLGRNVVTFA